MIPLGVLCQSRLLGLNIDFNVFPFIDTTGNFTIVNHGSIAQSSGKALFSNTVGQYLEPVGVEDFRLQEKTKISFKASLNSIGVAQVLWFIEGASNFGLRSQPNGALIVQMDGAVDNYYLATPSTGILYGSERTVDVIYDPAAGTLQLLVDGSVEINQTGVTSRPNGSRTITVGTDNPALVNFPIDGLIDDFIVTFPS